MATFRPLLLVGAFLLYQKQVCCCYGLVHAHRLSRATGHGIRQHHSALLKAQHRTHRRAQGEKRAFGHALLCAECNTLTRRVPSQGLQSTRALLQSAGPATTLYGRVASFDAKHRPMYVTLLKETREPSPDWLRVLNKAGF